MGGKMSSNQSGPLIHRTGTLRQSQTMSFVGADISKAGTIIDRVREYRLPSQSALAKRPSIWSRILRPIRRPKSVKRVLDHPANGATVERFRKLLERSGCNVEDVEHSGDAVMIDFTFLDDGGHCTAFLTDRLRDGSYLRCNVVARVGLEFPLDHVNKLNQYSKFLRFYNIKNNSLFIEYSFVLIELPDSAVLANIEVFHASIMYIASSGFVYDGMNNVSIGAKQAGDRPARTAFRQRALWDHINYPGKGGASWSADDEDHAWRVGVIHAYAHEKFNPPTQAEYRAIYLDGYKTTTDDEGLDNEYPES